MQTDEIQKYVSGTGAKVVASDQLPEHRINNGIYISNTDEIDKAGMHWVVLAVLKKPTRKIIYFDTLAVPPLTEHFYKFLKYNVEGGNLELNKNIIQSEDSAHCGRYSVLLVRFLAEGGTFEEFCKMYSANPQINDKKLEGQWALFMDAWYKGENAARKR